MKILSVYSGASPLVVWGLKSRFLIDKRMRPSPRRGLLRPPGNTFLESYRGFPLNHPVRTTDEIAGVGAEGEEREEKARENEGTRAHRRRMRADATIW